MTGETKVLIGYARVSKADGSQTTDRQRDALLAAGVDPEQLYEDQASGKQDDRPQLAACLKALRSGDTLIVWKLDRLGRDLRHLVNVVHDLTDRGVGLKVLTGQGAAIDTTTANWPRACRPPALIPAEMMMESGSSGSSFLQARTMSARTLPGS